MYLYQIWSHGNNRDISHLPYKLSENISNLPIQKEILSKIKGKQFQINIL